MIKTLTITLILATIAATAVFYSFTEIKNSAQIAEIILEDNKANLLPISANKTLDSQLQLQAAAYAGFLNLFGSQAQVGLGLVEPVAGFSERITKKSFGIYITPETSPVSPDKFTGFHTGVDSEFTDSQEEIPVRSIADGTIIVRKWVSGYGGLVIIKHTINNVSVFAIYGHLDEASFPASDIIKVKAGDTIGVLGDDHSEETDGARKHLHFSIYTGEKLDARGYVKTEEELANWLNPVDLFK